MTMLALISTILEEPACRDGVVNVTPSRSSGKVVSAMLHDPRVRVISFTGSTDVGRKLCMKLPTISPPAMELGGNAPFIVFDDADIDAAIDGAMIAKVRNMGEACTAANRFYVHEKVHDEFAKKLTAKMAGLKMGNGLDDGVALGPLVNKEGFDKVISWSTTPSPRVRRCLRGARRRVVRVSSTRRPSSSNMSDTPRCSTKSLRAGRFLCKPLNPRTRWLARANDSEYGLVAYLYTGDLSRGLRVSENWTLA